MKIESYDIIQLCNVGEYYIEDINPKLGELQKIESQRQFDVLFSCRSISPKWNYWIKPNSFDAKLREDNSLIPCLIEWSSHSI